MNRAKKKAQKRAVAGDTQQAHREGAYRKEDPCKDACQSVSLPAPTKADKIAMGISLTLLLAWISFLAVLALGK